MSFLEKNKKIILEQYPGFWDELISGDEPSLEDIKIENTPSGNPTLCINGIYVHSPRDPLREGQRFVQAAAGDGCIVVLGFGLGYAAEAAAGLGRTIIIIEKYKNLLLKAFELRDFSELFSRNKIIFVIGGSGDGIMNALAIANVHLSADDKKPVPSIIRNKTLISLDELWYKSVEDKIRIWAMKDNVNTATHKRFGKRWVRNLSKNMSAIRDLPGVSHLTGLASEDFERNFTRKHGDTEKKEGAFIPIFLAAAGPSLDKIKPLLRDIYDRCIIVTVDTSLRFFSKNGIQPDFVLVVDPQYWNSRHLDRCVYEQTALIAESAVYPPVLNLPFKNKFLCSSLFPLGTFIEKQVDPKGRLAAGGSVATSAWDFARLLGSREIWIAGLDLAFPDFKTHFKGARFEEQSTSQSYRFNPIEKWIVRVLRDGFPFKARSASGGQVLTDSRLSLYAAWFENQFSQNPQVQNFCLFQDGLAISGLQVADKEKFLALPVRRDEINRRIQQVFLQIETEFNEPQEKQKRHERYDNAVLSLTNGLNSIKTAAQDGAYIARRALRSSLNPSQKDKVLKELDNIMRRVTESEVKEVAGFLFPQLEEENTENEGKDPLHIYFKSSLKLFNGIIEALD